MSQSKFCLLVVSSFLFSSSGVAKLPDNPSTSANTPGQVHGKTATKISSLEENYQICADQWLSIIENAGGKGERAVEFQLLMSIKCGEKAKKSIFFGSNAPQNPSVKAEKAVALLREIYPRVKTDDGQRRVRDLIQQIRQRPEFPIERPNQTESASATAR